MSDYAIAVVHEPLLARVSELAPGVRLRIDHLGPDARSSDRVLLEYDALIAPLGLRFPGRVPAAVARPDGLPGGPGAIRDLGADGLTLDDLAGCRTPWPTFGPGILTPVDRVFGELGIDRRIAGQRGRAGCRCRS